jgi:hypothetical protein
MVSIGNSSRSIDSSVINADAGIPGRHVPQSIHIAIGKHASKQIRVAISAVISRAQPAGGNDSLIFLRVSRRVAATLHQRIRHPGL